MTSPDPPNVELAIRELDEMLTATDLALAARYPGPSRLRQPVHTVYVPADRFDADIPTLWGAQALAMLDDNTALLPALAAEHLDSCLPRVCAKLERQPIEDLRVDFEDGYGFRADDEEDADATSCGVAMAALAGRAESPFVLGIRFKGLDPAPRARAVRSLDLVLRALVAEAALPDRFVITLPKLRAVAQVDAMVRLCDLLEADHGLDPGQLKLELQVEVPSAVTDSAGVAMIAPALHAASSRCIGLHYGTYDYTAACGVTAANQSLAHPAADHAKAVMQAVAAETGVVVSDGSTQVLPVGTPDDISRAWAYHASLVTRALERGFYQGWDLHPGQLVTRYLATFAFYRSALPATGARLRAYFEKSSSGVVDEPATIRGLASVIVRGVDCGAVDIDEAVTASGLEHGELGELSRTGRLSR